MTKSFDMEPTKNNKVQFTKTTTELYNKVRFGPPLVITSAHPDSLLSLLAYNRSPRNRISPTPPDSQEDIVFGTHYRFKNTRSNVDVQAFTYIFGQH